MNKKLFYAILILAVLVFGILILKKVKTGDYSNTVNTGNYNQSKTYTSNTLKFSIAVPESYMIKDTGISVSLYKNANAINVSRSGTNFNDVNDYLDDLSLKNKIKFDNRETLTIGDLSAVKTIIKHPISGSPDELAYFIYKDYFMYSLGTTTPALYGDLDQIARSFRYTP